MDFLQFLSAFGLGALVTALVQAWLSLRADIAKRNFQEKKECYVGLLEAYHAAAVDHNAESNGKRFAYWQMRCDLVAPKNVREAIQRIVDTNDDKSMRYQSHETLKEVLRSDLGVTKL